MIDRKALGKNLLGCKYIVSDMETTRQGIPSEDYLRILKENIAREMASKIAHDRVQVVYEPDTRSHTVSLEVVVLTMQELYSLVHNEARKMAEPWGHNI